MIKNRKITINKDTIIAILIPLFIVSFFLSLGNGAVKISPVGIIKSVLYDKGSVNYQIIWNVRLPRTIVAALVGISLSLSGA
ncbi:MAG: iron chelate uptake ABC transporter family permease subunit, partial [Tissierellaceae bacterium]